MYSCIDEATVKLFADDTNLFVSSQSIDEVTAIANTCISKLNKLTWFLANKVSLSLDKTCFSVFGVHENTARCKVQLRLDHVTLKHVNCCKYLFGVKLPTGQGLSNIKVVIFGTNFLMI